MVSFAYIAKGKLHVWKDGEDREIESSFAEAYQDRVRALHRKQAWKEEGSGARFQRGGMPLWGDKDELEAVPVAFTGVAPGPSPNTLLYTLSTGVVGGVFLHDLKSGEEKRIFHSADHRIESIATAPHHAVVACTLRGRDGSSAVAVMAPDGSELSPVTDGDVIDLAPAWLPEDAASVEERHQLVFQSAGMGRDEQGNFVAIGPAATLLLDAEHGEMQTLLDSERSDHLQPRMNAERDLFFIRRPYVSGHAVNPFRALADVVLFPFRLLRAVVSWLSFFSMKYTGKPLVSSGSARQRSLDLRQMMMTGNLAAARADARADAEKEFRKAIRDWVLVKRTEAGEETALASRVCCFDLAPEGVVYSDGFRVVLQQGAAHTELAKVRHLTQLCVVPTS
ncbi:MAG: hypothetical protein AAGE52_07570 [Myxococcota bacterium]